MPYPVGFVPGQRFRLEQWAPLLEADGIDIVFSEFLDPAVMDILYARGHILRKGASVLRGYARRMADLGRLDAFDVAYVYREAAFFGSSWIERFMARRCPVVFDFDDAIYLPAATDDNPQARFLKWGGKVEAICRAVDCVTVGNDTLAAFARRHAAHVEVIPTTIDTDAYRMTDRRANARPVVGWTGSRSTARYLEALAPALRMLAGAGDFELHVIGASIAIDGVNVRCTPWSAATEVGDIRGFDVGLMPLTDDEWARGKCALKALQYMALGIPPVVSPVGVNSAVVRDGVNGFHARGHEEWVDRVGRLLHDPSLRARLGAEARRTVEERYSARVQAPRLSGVLRAVQARRMQASAEVVA
jgi:glycosyltransferase involved in cell wall biosynthesis